MTKPRWMTKPRCRPAERPCTAVLAPHGEGHSCLVHGNTLSLTRENVCAQARKGVWLCTSLVDVRKQPAAGCEGNLLETRAQPQHSSVRQQWHAVSVDAIVAQCVLHIPRPDLTNMDHNLQSLQCCIHES